MVTVPLRSRYGSERIACVRRDGLSKTRGCLRKRAHVTAYARSRKTVCARRARDAAGRWAGRPDQARASPSSACERARPNSPSQRAKKPESTAMATRIAMRHGSASTSGRIANPPSASAADQA